MGFIGSLFGGSSGDTGGAGLNYSADRANILNPVTTDQANAGNSLVNSGLSQQQALYNQLLQQNGIQNQSDVYNQGQALAGQLQGIANGTGPNPALQQLQNTTGQNVQNQAALMASQRGTGANAGLLARQAAMQGANIQQQAVGQGAALGAQQQLAGVSALQNQQGLLGNLAAQQVDQQGSALNNYNSGAQNYYQSLLSSINNQNNANVAMQGNINSNNATISNTAAQGQQALAGGVFNSIGSAGSMLGGSMAKGGMVRRYAEGGVADAEADPNFQAPASGPSFGIDYSGVQGPAMGQNSPVNEQIPTFNLSAPQSPQGQSPSLGINLGGVGPQVGPMSMVGQSLFSPFQAQPMQSAPAPSVPAAQVSSSNPGADALYKGVSSALSAGESNQSKGSGGGGGGGGLGSLVGLAALLSKGGTVNGETLAAQGKKVPGKAKVKGDSYSNDNVPALLSPGEVVIPRHVMQSKDPVGNSAKFVQAILAKNGLGGKKK